jgi:tetratricopeptide (TPR) repeat protein
VLVGILCLGLVVAAYSDVFGNAFHFDDSHVVVNNVYIRSLRNVPRFFTDARTASSQPRNATYRPLVTLSLAVDYWLGGGLSPVVFHASQLLLLVVFGAVLARFYWRVMERCLPGPGNGYLALFGATLFCIHAVNTETMNLMHARSEILSGLGVLLGFLVYWAFPRGRGFLVYMLPVALGALAKPPAVIFAPLLFVWTFLEARSVGGRGNVAALGRATLASAPALVAGVLVYGFVERVMRAPDMVYGGGDALHYALTQPWVWLEYVRLFFLPVGLTADTDLGLVTDWYDTRVIAGLTVIALLVVIAWRCARSRTAWPIAFGLAWFALGLLPTSSILPLAEPMNEHRVFLAYVGFILAVVWGARLVLPRLVPGGALRWAAAVGLGALVLVGHAIGTHARNRVWHTDESLWADVTQKSPRNGRAWMNYGLALMARGDYPRAKACFERALEFTPNYSTLEVNLAILNGAMGEPKAAEMHFRRALQLEPRQPSSHYYFARWLIAQGRAPEAVAHLEEVIRLSPADDHARDMLMDLHGARGDDGSARRIAADYLAILPGDARATAYLAGRTPIELTPASYDGYFQEGVTLGRRQNYVESALAYREAVRLNPRSPDALNNLGWTLGKLGFYREALPYLEEAVRLRPDFQLARNNLAWTRNQVAVTP